MSRSQRRMAGATSHFFQRKCQNVNVSIKFQLSGGAPLFTELAPLCLIRRDILEWKGQFFQITLLNRYWGTGAASNAPEPFQTPPGRSARGQKLNRQR